MISGDADRKSDDNDRTRTSVRDKQANANQTGQDGLKAYKGDLKSTRNKISNM